METLAEDDLTPWIIRLAEDYGHFISADFAGYVLWNETGWPCFWNYIEGETQWQECLERQLRDFFRSMGKEGLHPVS